MSGKHNPGSKEAVKAGCRCPIIDNNRGAGYLGQKGIFVSNGNCPYHQRDDDE